MKTTYKQKLNSKNKYTVDVFSHNVVGEGARLHTGTVNVSGIRIKSTRDGNLQVTKNGQAMSLEDLESENVNISVESNKIYKGFNVVGIRPSFLKENVFSSDRMQLIQEAKMLLDALYSEADALEDNEILEFRRTVLNALGKLERNGISTRNLAALEKLINDFKEINSVREIVKII